MTNDEWRIVLAQVEPSATLLQLSLSGIVSLSDRIAILARLDNDLRHRLRHLTVTADDLVKLQCLPRLERLVLFRSVVTPGAIEMLASRAQRLQRLACGLNGLPTDADLAPLVAHPSLSRLDVSESVLTDAGFLAFAATPVTATPVTDAGVASFQARRPDVHIIR